MWNWISKAEELRNQGSPYIITTVTQVTGSTPRETGAKMIVLGNGEFYGTIGGGNLERLVLQDAKESHQKPSPGRVIRYPLGAKTGQCCGGIVEVLFESVNCGPLLYLFGAGHVGQAVCKTLASTSFSVHLIDDREEWRQADAIPKEIIRHSEDWSEFFESALWDPDKTYAVVMTHRHDLDQEIILALLQKPAKYIGLIGSQAKWQRFRQRLTARGVSPEALKRVRSPIGLPIGGKAPQEVAISLAAELIQTHYSSGVQHP